MLCATQPVNEIAESCALMVNRDSIPARRLYFSAHLDGHDLSLHFGDGALAVSAVVNPTMHDTLIYGIEEAITSAEDVR
jgi:hypothetical protein